MYFQAFYNERTRVCQRSVLTKWSNNADIHEIILLNTKGNTNQSAETPEICDKTYILDEVFLKLC